MFIDCSCLHVKTAPQITRPKITQVRLHVKTTPQITRPKITQVRVSTEPIWDVGFHGTHLGRLK